MLEIFFVKYFGAVCNDGYYNSKTGFRSYFLLFDDGARLEIMNKPQMEDRSKIAGEDRIYSYSI